MIRNVLTNIFSSIQLLFAGLWLVVRIILEYFGFISDGNDRTTGIKRPFVKITKRQTTNKVLCPSGFSHPSQQSNQSSRPAKHRH